MTGNSLKLTLERINSNGEPKIIHQICDIEERIIVVKSGAESGLIQIVFTVLPEDCFIVSTSRREGTVQAVLQDEDLLELQEQRKK